MMPSAAVAPARGQGEAVTPGRELVFGSYADSFGLGVVHLLWALEHIELGAIPWDRMLLEPMLSEGGSMTVVTPDNPPEGAHA